MKSSMSIRDLRLNVSVPPDVYLAIEELMFITGTSKANILRFLLMRSISDILNEDGTINKQKITENLSKADVYKEKETISQYPRSLRTNEQAL